MKKVNNSIAIELCKNLLNDRGIFDFFNSTTKFNE